MNIELPQQWQQGGLRDTDLFDIYACCNDLLCRFGRITWIRWWS